MNDAEFQTKAQSILQQLCEHPRLGMYIDPSLQIPAVYRGSGEIHLIILGQDPTVKNERSRGKIGTVLNLDRSGNLRNYLSQICAGLGLDLTQNVYATNLFKNFFTSPPTQIKEFNVFQEALPFWLPLLQAEISEFPEAFIITLGELLLAALVYDPEMAKVRDYWGYREGWKKGETKPFAKLASKDNRLGRTIFPYPHQPSLRKTFYQVRLSEFLVYTSFEINVKAHIEK